MAALVVSTGSNSLTLNSRVTFTNTGLPTPPGDDDAGDRFANTNSLIGSANDTVKNYLGGHAINCLNAADDALQTMQEETSSAVSDTIKQVLDSDPVQAIRQTITTLVDGLPALLRVLDDVAQIHPFIKIAVGAFRVAVELDFKRKDNDRKISLLFVEMRDMMAVLVQLQDVASDKREGKGGHTIQSRMQHLIDKTEQDIRQCANGCNAYAKKRLLSKVLQSSMWDDTFQGFVKKFTARRGEFEFALSLFIGGAVNTANTMLLTLDEKMNRILQYFEAYASPEERELTRLVNQQGGAHAVLNDETLLRGVYDARTTTSMGSTKAKGTERYGEMKDEFEAQKLDLKVDPVVAMRDNLAQFERKFTMQRIELEEETKKTMHIEGDRIIESVTSGPYVKILDPDIREVWRDMRWRGNVKARHFVLALRDHFRDKFEQSKVTTAGIASMASVSTNLNVSNDDSDKWALEYINVTRLQPVIEAFDDDASGFITIAEVNAFTTARPVDWSLLHWLAYWAVGYQMVMSDYAKRIDIILDKMFSIRSQVLPANRSTVERYLNRVWTLITELTAGFRRAPMDDILYTKFESYIKSEEDRLRRNFETVKYDFDAADTVALVRGPGRIERHLFPMLYLMLKRDFEIMRVARIYILPVDQLEDAIHTLSWLFEAIDDRYMSLQDLFKQQKEDSDQQFKIFGFEMYRYWHDNTELWSMKRLRKLNIVDVPYDDTAEAQDIDHATILKHPLRVPEDMFVPLQFEETEDDRNADTHMRAILGPWSCFYGIDDRWPAQAMFHLNFHVLPSDTRRFQCSGTLSNGVDWECNGVFSVGEGGRVEYKLTITNPTAFYDHIQHLCGTLDENGGMFSGRWSSCSSKGAPKTQGTFVCKRLPATRMRFWPSPDEYQRNRARALWRFAIFATLDDVRRRLRPWSFLKARLENGKRYVALITLKESANLTVEEWHALARCLQNMTPDEAHLYQMLRNLHERNVPCHHAHCDVCGHAIRGARIVCLSCGVKCAIDLCDKAQCRNGEVTLDARDDLSSPHLPTHDVFKVRTAIHYERELGPAYRAAQKALRKARKILADGCGAANGDTEVCAQSEVGEQTITNVVRCIKCNVRVSQPCWYCIDCEEDIFVCSACDEMGGVSSHSGGHKATHALVRCQRERESEENMWRVRLATLESNQREREKVFDEKMDALQGRLARIENLLLAQCGPKSSFSVETVA